MVSSDTAENLATARALVRRGLTAMLATAGAGGAPHASLVAYACRADGAPLFLFSTLSAHTKNLARDPRAAVLVAGAPAAGADPLDAARVTLLGRIAPSTGAADRARYLRRRPEAETYAGFGDFAVFALDVADVHYVGGFARARAMAARDLLLDLAAAPALMAAEADILAHMNADHAEAIGLYATKLAGQAPGAWTLTGLDPEGLDLRAGPATARILFDAPVTTPETARAALVALAKRARAMP